MRRAFLVLLMALGLAGAVNGYVFNRPGPLAEDTAVIVPPGASLKAAARLLKDVGALAFEPSFYWTARLQGAAGDLRAGEYLLPARASAADILTLLREGKTILHKITVAEGLTSAEVAALLLAEPLLSDAIAPVPREGTLLPETYFFARGDSRHMILDWMRANQHALLEALMDGYDFSLAFRSAEEAVILASLVEEETALPEERPMIAAAFLNRLKKGMRLQSDPTVVYGLSQGVPLGHPLQQSELEQDTPYNTYIHSGLPPGPISNPGRAALEAVFHPAKTDALYFVADGNGGHVFAASIEEHSRNVAKWRKIEKDGQRP